ncbi:MAG: glycoside hydrolase family 43 protein [Acidimicrobiales bacterium]
MGDDQGGIGLGVTRGAHRRRPMSASGARGLGVARPRLRWLAAGLSILCAGVAALAAAGPAAAAHKADPPLAVAPVNIGFPGVDVTPGMDIPDPFVVQLGGLYIMFSSQETFYGPNVPLMVSDSLTTWPGTILDALPTLPKWAEPGFTWSPDVRYLHGRWIMWFNASIAGAAFGATKCIGVATSISVVGPYVSKAQEPLICQLNHLGSIDPRSFVDPQGRLWLVWKSDDNANLSASTHSSIYIQRLSADGLHVVGQPTTLLTADQTWEGRIVEAPDMVYAAGHYWLFFSGNWFNEPAYAIGLEECAGPAGPCSPSSAGPWLASNGEGAGPGEESLFNDGKRWWMLYAPFAVSFQTPTPRPAVLARLDFGPHGPEVVAPDTAAWLSAPPAPKPPRFVAACTSRQFQATCDAWRKRLKTGR